MTGDEHYEAAEKGVLQAARHLSRATDSTYTAVASFVGLIHSEAQVHATLALAAYTNDANLNNIRRDERQLHMEP